MHAFLHVTVAGLLQMGHAMTDLSWLVAAFENRKPVPGDFTLAAIFVIAVVIAASCIGWALLERRRTIKTHDEMCRRLQGAQSQIRFREALLGAGGEAIAVLGVDMMAPQSYRGGGALLESCLAGPDAAVLAQKMDALLEHGTSFALTVRTANRPSIAVRGGPIGSRAAVFFRQEEGRLDSAIDLRAEQAETRLRHEINANADVMNHIPVAAAVFSADGRLCRYNAACAEFWGVDCGWLDARPTLGEILDRLRELRRLPEQRDFAAWKKQHVDLLQSAERRIDAFWHLPDGRSYRMRARPHLKGGIFMTFENVSEQLRLEAALKERISVQRAVLEAMEDAIAVFGADGRLKANNTAFASLWHLEVSDVANEPHLGGIVRLAAERLGRFTLWDIVSAGVTAGEPERYVEWSKTERVEGKLIALSLARLPDGSTMVSFRDDTEVERFEQGLKEHPDMAPSLAAKAELLRPQSLRIVPL